MSRCCCQHSAVNQKTKLPLICLVPREERGAKGPGPSGSVPTSTSDFSMVEESVLRKHFKFPERALYLDTMRRPLITFPMTQEGRTANFNMFRKTKTNQQILDGLIDGSEAVIGTSTFPYQRDGNEKIKKKGDDKEEVVYILQLPDLETICPIHNQVIKTPRFIWHTCKSGGRKDDEATSGTLKKGKGPMHKPKPWLLSRHTDFDMLSQW